MQTVCYVFVLVLNKKKTKFIFIKIQVPIQHFTLRERKAWSFKKILQLVSEFVLQKFFTTNFILKTNKKDTFTKKRTKPTISAPLLIILFCYVTIVRVFRTVTSHASETTVSSARALRDRARHGRLLWTTVKAVLCFVAGWTPYATIALFASLGKVRTKSYDQEISYVLLMQK